MAKRNQKSPARPKAKAAKLVSDDVQLRGLNPSERRQIKSEYAESIRLSKDPSERTELRRELHQLLKKSVKA